MKRPNWLQRKQLPTPPPVYSRPVSTDDIRREELVRAKRLVRQTIADILRGPLLAEQKVRFLAMALGIPLDTESTIQEPRRDPKQQFLETDTAIPIATGAFRKAYFRKQGMWSEPGQP